MDSIESNAAFEELFRIQNVKDESKEVTTSGSTQNETNEIENVGKKSRRKKDDKIWYNLW